MLLARSLAELAALPQSDLPSVVTIGNFDGVHAGHRTVIAEVRARAAALQARSVVVTFDPHPTHVLPAAKPCPLITPTPRKLELLAQTGVDLTLLLPFNEALYTLTARQFAQQVLCDALHALEIHEGESFRFGHRAEGDMNSLAELGREMCFTVHPEKPVVRRGAPISSSRIRKVVAAGELATARALLGRSYTLDSTPAKGRGYGTRYAVPTINLATQAASAAAPCPELLPANGVYITTLQVGEGPDAPIFNGVTNAGNRPTFGADSFAIETHLFDFRPIALTEQTPLRLTFLQRLREERRFSDPEALKAQIGRDVRRAQRYFHLCRLLGDTAPILAQGGERTR
jgi:riboflavin kinase / FMN adenylyltransferase